MLINYFCKNLHRRCLTGFWMYFAKIFRTTFSKHLCFPTFLDSFFQNVVSNNGKIPSQVALSSVFRLALIILCSTFSYLYLFQGNFLSSLQRWFSCSFSVCLCYTLEGIFHKKNIKKASGVIIVHSELEKVYFIFCWKEMIGNSSTNHWIDMDLRRCKNMAMWTL